MERRKIRTDEFHLFDLEVGVFSEPIIKGFKEEEAERIRGILKREPELRRRFSNVTIRPQRKGKASLGTTESFVDEDKGFISEDVTVRINKSLFKRPEKLVKVIAHESEHALQHKAYTPEENRKFFEKDIQSNISREEEAIDAQIELGKRRFKPLSLF